MSIHYSSTLIYIAKQPQKCLLRDFGSRTSQEVNSARLWYQKKKSIVVMITQEMGLDGMGRGGYPCITDHGGRLFCSPISVTKRHEEHRTDDAPYGYISNTSQLPHFTCPTSWASSTKLIIWQHWHWTCLTPFGYESSLRQEPQTIWPSSEGGGGGVGGGGKDGSGGKDCQPGGGPSSSSSSASAMSSS